MPTFMLDSGAFSAWSRGQQIDLDHYIAYIKANADLLDYYVALDVIPGSFGVTPTPQQVEQSAQAGWNNLICMQEHGLDPIPVFHMHESLAWLHKMIDHGVSYIGISPANDCTTDQKRVWLDRVFDAICDDDGWPVVKTHAFGVTAIPLLTRYPWYSADSIAWITYSGRGGVMAPLWDNKNDCWDYHNADFAFRIVDAAPPKETKGDVWTRYKDKTRWRQNPILMARLLHWLEDAGSSLQKAETNYLERARICCFFFQEFERLFHVQPFRRRKAALFDAARPRHKREGLHIEHMRIFFTMNMARKYGRVLAQQKAENRLLSFVYFQHDVELGLLDIYANLKPAQENDSGADQNGLRKDGEDRRAGEGRGLPRPSPVHKGEQELASKRVLGRVR